VHAQIIRYLPVPQESAVGQYALFRQQLRLALKGRIPDPAARVAEKVVRFFQQIQKASTSLKRESRKEAHLRLLDVAQSPFE
jgi:hypothetical protein